MVQSYDMQESRERLELRGFHPAISSKKPQELIDAWRTMVTKHSKRPTKEEFVEGTFEWDGHKYAQSRKQMTVASNSYNETVGSC